jgi:hypothetical protein
VHLEEIVKYILAASGGYVPKGSHHMGKRTKLFLIGSSVAIMLAMTAGGASARNLSTSSQRFRITWSPLTFTAGTSVVACPVTLEGSFHSRTIVKSLSSLIGYITRAVIVGTLPTCVGGTATVHTERLPWHVRYGGFRGRLPTIEGVILQLIGADFSVRPLANGVTCRATTSAAEPGVGIAQLNAAGEVTGLRADETARIGLEGFLCAFAGEGSFSGTGAVDNGSGARITVRLI